MDTVRAERQSARMSKITHDGLTRSDTGCFLFAWQQWASKGKPAPLTTDYIHCESKKNCATFIFTVTLANVGRFLADRT